jgi:uncharacterized protein YdiU (UPF0061 family)
VYFGELKDQVLIKIYEPVYFRKDYTVEEILSKLAIYENYKKLTDKARLMLHPFDEHDN